MREIKTNIVAIGMLRQWLNEDKITDPEKMVTNEDIENWLTPKGFQCEQGKTDIIHLDVKHEGEETKLIVNNMTQYGVCSTCGAQGNTDNLIEKGFCNDECEKKLTKGE